MAIRYLSGINVDSNTLFVDSTNNRVGIGTDSPTSSLTVNGTITSGVVISTSDSTEQIVIRLASDTNKQFIFGRTSTHARLFAVTQNVGYVPIAINESGGNVLIGTTTDAGYKLYVVGTGTSTNLGVVGNIRAGGTGTSGGEIIASGALGNGNYVSLRHDDTNGYITVTRTVYDGHLILQPYGNVGIGTTSPSYKTSIVAANGNYWNGTAFTGTPLALSIENSEPGGYDPVLIYNQADSGGTLKNSGAIGMVGTGPWTAGNNALQVSDMYFLVRNSSGSISERLRIKSTGAAQLKAYGSGTFTGTPAYNLGVDASGNVIELPGGVVDGSGTANYVSKWSDANTLTDSVIYDNGTNVSIGTTANPGSRTNIYLSEAGATPNAILRLQNTGSQYLAKMIITDGNTNDAVIGYQGGVTAATQYLGFGLGTAITQMVLTAAGNVGIGTTSPASLLQVVGASVEGQGLLNISNTHAGGSVYYPAAKIRNTRGNHSFGIISEFSIGSVGGTDRPSILFYSDAAASSWNVGQVTAAWGLADSFGIGYRASNTPSTFNSWPTNYFTITTGGNVLIGTTTDAGYKLRVNGSSYFDAPILCYTGNAYITAITSDGVGSNNGFGYSFLITGANHEIGRVTGIYETSGGGGSGGLGFWTRGSGTLSAKMTLNSGGTLTLSNYGSGSKTGTVAYNLAVDASGNIIETAGGVVDGSGTANYVTKWQDANTVTDSQIVDNGTNVGINNASPKTKLDVNGAIGFGSKTLNISDTFVTVLTVNMSNHTGCYVKITAFGDWSGHSAVAYLGEFFLQNGASAYNEPGVIIRQVDNTNTDDIVAQIVDPAGTGTRDFEIQLKTTSASYVPFSAAIQYEVRGQYNSVS